MIYKASVGLTTEDELNNAVIPDKKILDSVVTRSKEFTKVILMKDFIDKYFSMLTLERYIEQVNLLNKNVVIEVDDKYHRIKTSNIYEKLKYVSSIEDFLELVMARTDEVVDAVNTLAKVYVDGQNNSLQISRQYATLVDTVGKLEEIIKEKDEDINSLVKSNNIWEQKITTLLNIINGRHNFSMSPEYLVTTRLTEFPKVIYFKEVTHTKYLGSMIHYLKKILDVNLNIKTRVLVLEPISAATTRYKYPELTICSELTLKQAATEDILMIGYYPDLFNNIMRNPSKADLLIILDRTMVEEVFLADSVVTDYIFCSNNSDYLEPYDIGVGNYVTIENNIEDKNIEYIKDFSKLSQDARLTKYSETAIIRRVLSIVKGVEYNG